MDFLSPKAQQQCARAANLLVEAFCDRPASGFPAILMTQREANVRFYQRLGLEVVNESTVGSNKYAFTNWCLVRFSSQS